VTATRAREGTGTYRDLALDPGASLHFNTRGIAQPPGIQGRTREHALDRAVESFAGVANPFSLRYFGAGEKSGRIGIRARVFD